MPFISFSCLIAVARPSSTMLSNIDESGHLYFVSDLRGRALCFSVLTMTLAVGFTYVAFIMSYIPSVPTLLRVFT